jgi:uncharacterized protein (DUF302 family)
MAADGLIMIASSFGPQETMDRLEAEVGTRSMTVFARIDHAAGAAAVGQTLRATEVLIFGNARGGTPLMQASQTIAIDLPLKALVFLDADAKTWLAYYDPHWLAQRHGITAALTQAIDALATVLNAVGHGLESCQERQTNQRITEIRPAKNAGPIDSF